MTYEMFKEIVILNIKKYLPDDWQEAKIERSQSHKVNFEKDSIVFIKHPGESMEMSPNVDVKHWYQKYLSGYSLEDVLDDLAEAVLDAERQVKPVKAGLDINKVRDNVFWQLIHTDQNRELLKELPHREFHDLSIIYVWLIQVNEKTQLCTSRITNGLAEQIGMSEEELYEVAKENTQKILPTVIKPMHEVINELMGENALGRSHEPDEPVPMYVLSNCTRNFGAAAMLDKDALQDLAEHCGENFYILPSSLHECIAIPQSHSDLGQLAEMVYEINMTQVELQDRLSNEVYQYDMETREVTLATDVPNKSLEEYGLEKEPTLGVAVHAR